MRTRLSVPYVVAVLHCPYIYLVAKSFLLQLVSLLYITLDQSIFEASITLLCKTQKSIDAFDADSTQLKWEKSFYFFAVDGFALVFRNHLKSYTRDFDSTVYTLAEKKFRRRSTIAEVADTLSAMMSSEQSPLHQLKELPSLQVYQTLTAIIDVLFAGEGALWNMLCRQGDNLQLIIWIAVASNYMNIGNNEEEQRVKKKIAKFIQNLSIANENFLVTRFRREFLEKRDGIRIFLREAGVYLYRKLTGTRNIENVNERNNYGVFCNSTKYTFSLSTKAITASALYRFVAEKFTGICKYLHAGGQGDDDEEGKADLKKSTSPIPSLAVLSDFQLWTSNGGRLFMLLTEYLYDFNYEPLELDPSITLREHLVVPETFLSVLCAVLDAEGSDDESSKKRDQRLKKLWALQDAFKDFGVRNFVIKMLNKALKSTYTSNFFVMVPLVLRIGSLMMAGGNKEMQNSFMKPIYGTNMSIVTPLRHILRECAAVYGSMTQDMVKKIETKMIRIVNEVLTFCRAFCGGHNKEARLFLKTQVTLGSRIDVVFDITSVICLLGEILAQTYIKYITFPFFIENLAPLIWDDGLGDKRRCIAWHDRSVDYLEVAQLIHTLGCGFKCLKDVVQGPCYENQQSALKVADILIAIFEYCGVMHLNSVTKVPTRGITGNSYRVVKLELGNPTNFLKKYREELVRHGKLLEEPLMRKTKEGQSDNLNFDVDLLQRISMETELSCLTFSLALLEGTSFNVVAELNQKLNYSILFQNMDGNFFSTSRKALFSGDSVLFRLRKESAVAYLTLISTFFSATGRSSAMLTSWIERCKRKGLDINAYNASVEIVGEKGDIQQIYFEIPSHIALYWPYPEVQKAKDYVVQTNDRDSPEEKINDFRRNIDFLLSIMARQKYLRYSMTPFLHAIFGGKPVAPQWLLYLVPRQRVMVLSLCLFLNIYYVYLTYRQRFPGYPGFDSYFTFLYDAINKEYNISGSGLYVTPFKIIGVVEWIHFSLNASIYLRSLLNSTAADSIESADDDDILDGDKGLILRLAGRFYRLMYGLVLVIMSEWWPALVTGFSILAIYVSQWFFVPCLLDVVQQFPLMRFLVEAVERNVVKIGFTILLALLLLYFYATIAYLSFPDQYTFNGHMDCGDLLTCFATHIDYGLNYAPNWDYGSFVKPDLAGWFATSPWGFLISSILGSFFVISFIILINLVLQSVISGVIIDTFGSMRQEAEAIDADIKGGCFICSISRDEFESNGIDYNAHIKDEHNMWKYVWLKYYLLEKDPLLFTGPESYAFEQMKEKASFLKLFPVKRSLALDRQKARAKSVESTIELKSVYELILSLEESQRQLKTALNDVKQAQDQQKDTSSNLQLKFARLQLLNRQALEEALVKSSEGLPRDKQGRSSPPIGRQLSSRTDSQHRGSPRQILKPSDSYDRHEM